MNNILETQNLIKDYAGHKALNQVSIEVPKGSIFGLLGPNGAGKTTLIRIINQITMPDSGTVLFNQENIEPKHRALIGYLPEERGLYRKMKVGEQCLYLAQLKGMSYADAKKKLKYWFEKFEIVGWWDKKVEELSKGMAQKIQFIVTVLHEPELLILDEPFSGFDPINTNLIKSEIMQLNENGTTIIFSTHNMASVEEICQDIALINHSQKILSGKMKDLKNDFKTNTYEIVFKGSLLKFTNALWTGAELIDSTEIEPEHFSATIKLLNKTTTNDLLNGLIPHVQIQGLKEVLPSMNDIFIQAVSNPQTQSEIA
ncbi:ATP-binding cassette domain-containing protein [bacterium SCSIO 12643]|nr:ATP-binding cassette domain-containing protein [bacterium SCSIO 12643]